MAGVAGNRAWVAYRKQPAKGTPAVLDTTGGAFKSTLSGGNVAPDRNIDNLAETDASRLKGDAFARSGGVTGSPEFYVRDSSAGALLFYALGADVVTGAGPNFIHTITPASVLPYVTFWRDIGDLLYERYQDCFVSTLTVKAGAGDPLTVSAGINGLRPTRLTAAPDLADPVDAGTEFVYNYNDATVTLAGGATALVSSFELGIDNNVNRQQTDDFVPYDLTAGQLEVSLSFDIIFETLAEYNKFHYGSAVGTVQDRTIYTTSADFQFDNGVNNQIKFTLPTLAYQEFPVEPNVGGDPIVASVRAVSQRPSGATPVLTTVVKNQEATY